MPSCGMNVAEWKDMHGTLQQYCMNPLCEQFGILRKATPCCGCKWDTALDGGNLQLSPPSSKACTAAPI
eukprot:6381379-Pyramimonas_sp.AAC.1